METEQSQTLWSFITVFVILSIFMWLLSYFPAMQVIVAKFTSIINTFMEIPFFGMILFAVVLSVWFSKYYTTPSPLDTSQNFINQFINIWIIFLSGVILTMTLYNLFLARSRKRKV